MGEITGYVLLTLGVVSALKAVVKHGLPELQETLERLFAFLEWFFPRLRRCIAACRADSADGPERRSIGEGAIMAGRARPKLPRHDD